ncbi:hypothetical protein H0H81_005494 [Sphagnurus paluster]|uniref:Rhamnogalacturonan lyase domain-containing protein n=1 Tax=Sphagnurus paluster TaxID=117069 RepID=A0A9P7KIU1_9AGAR|nr:hypothetical protein H0H81_005494 [Sphagnurus paluster]
MSNWGPLTFTIAESSVDSFPMAQFKAVRNVNRSEGPSRRLILSFTQVNNPTTIKWTATPSEIGARTLRIRTTQAFAGGRPQITVNSWTSTGPPRKQNGFYGLVCFNAS